MALILAFLGAIATLAGVALAACHALRMLTLVGGVLPIVPFIGMVGASLPAGGIAFFTFARIFGHPHYAGSLADGGVAALACGYVLTSRILSLLGRRDAATQAVAGFSETARRFPRSSGLPRVKALAMPEICGMNERER
ncbi:MAG: hypothetical protein LBQ62_11050 [Candidatus Accumulibacter sp.]|jgi:hypothetical protein|nr:hypothetical protein [Accumulibacter sp.]